MSGSAVKNILVLGGTGFVGRAVCERLVRRRSDGRIVVPTRRRPHGSDLLPLPTVVLQGADVHDESQLQRLVAGCDAVIHLVAILHGSAEAFDRVHVQLPRKLAAACRAAGVRRLVHVSALGVGDVAPSNYLRSKTAGEAALRDAGLDLTVLRPSVIFGADDRFLNLFASMQSVLPVVPLAGAHALFQPVWVDDVAAAIVRALDHLPSVGQTYEAVGPQVYSLADLVRLAGRWAGHERPVLALPGFVGRVQAALMALMPGEPLMSTDNLDSMKRPSVASGSLPTLDALGIQPTALGAVGPGYLAPVRGCGRLDQWRAQAH